MILGVQGGPAREDHRARSAEPQVTCGTRRGRRSRRFAARRTRCSSTRCVYNKDKIERPRSWADYWQPEKRYGDKIKGHVINYNPANLLSVYALIHAAQLGGGGVDNMEPAWALLKAQKPYVGVVVTGSAEAAPHFENGEVWISPYWSARAGYYIGRGLPYGMVDAEGRRDRPASTSACVPVGAQEQEARLRVHQLRARPGDAARMGLAYFSSPARGDITDWPKASPRRQIVTKEQFDQDPVPGLRGDRRAPQGLDAEVAGDHGLSRQRAGRPAPRTARGC